MPEQSPLSLAPPLLGATLLPGGRCSFGVWAPSAERLVVELLPRGHGSDTRLVPLVREGDRHQAIVDGVSAGDRYQLVFPDGRKRPDPRSRRQPGGVHGPSAVVDPRHLAGVQGRPKLPPLADWVIYELHPGTFTPEGTFDGIVPHLSYLRDELGVNAIELMPVCPFPGTRGWGYDGVSLFAVHEGYGGPAGLARLIAAAHAAGLAVIIDAVYNHLGPDGNYLREFGPYFTDKHHTPWGDAVNFDAEGAEGVRQFVIDAAVAWIAEHGADALRLDAIHAIADSSQPHVLADLAAAVQRAGGLTICESDLNDPVTVKPRHAGGFGHDAQWTDDFHHALHALLTGERTGYYADFGAASDLAKAYASGFVLDGTRDSGFRGHRHGKSPDGARAEHHVVFLQNHDQVGNRPLGDRIAELAGASGARIGAVALLMSPGVPLLFQGEEYAAPQPFPYFTAHTDEALGRAVTAGRAEEVRRFGWTGEGPDPQDESTFRSAVLDLSQRRAGQHGQMLRLYRELLGLRRRHAALAGADRGARTVAKGDDEKECVTLVRSSAGGDAHLAVVLSFGRRPPEARLALPPGRWLLVLDTEDRAFGGAGGTAPAELFVPASGTVLLQLPQHAAWIYERVSSSPSLAAMAPSP